MKSTLYLTRNGLLEPLGQSQVLSYLRGLSRDHQITLITYEKHEDWNDSARMAHMREECDRHGIRWRPQKFLSGPPVIAPALSIVRMVWLVWRAVRAGHADLIHARSYIPAAVALAVHRMAGVPFIFDMRALWPEELIIAGRLRRGALLHRAIVLAERACLRRAAAVVSLTNAAVSHLRSEYPEAMSEQTVFVIPTCADLERFVPVPATDNGLVIGCLGTVLSGWFKIDWLISFFHAVARHDSEIRFELTTKDNSEQVRAVIDPERKLEGRLTIAPAAPEEVHKVLQRQTASAMFFTEGLSKMGSSPTRMAEILGCGLPVVANGGVGDVAQIITDYRVGVLVRDPSEKAMTEAWDELLLLLKDPDLPRRCRTAAEEVFSLDTGTKAYRRLYAGILSGIN
jgi:glycosyltransferase involved in cell wall biosynthesis